MISRKIKYKAAAFGLAIGFAIGVFIGMNMFRDTKQCEGVIEENKLLKDLIYQYENYTIESP
jgi:hypothetical protein